MSKMADWQEKVQELVDRKWDVENIRARLSGLRENGFGRDLDWADMQARRAEILDQVQLRGEEYEYLSFSCSKGSLLALLECFGLGNWEMIRAMSPFPGFGMTGGICGAVTGSLFALGLFFGSDDIEDFDGTGRTMNAAREFVDRFKKEFGGIMCPEVQEESLFGRYMDPRASQENFEAFQKASGPVKCALPPGMGARLAAEIILDSRKS